MLSKYWTSIRDSRVETLGGCLSGCSAGEYDKGTCILLSMSVRIHETQSVSCCYPRTAKPLTLLYRS